MNPRTRRSRKLRRLRKRELWTWQELLVLRHVFGAAVRSRHLASRGQLRTVLAAAANLRELFGQPESPKA